MPDVLERGPDAARDRRAGHPDGPMRDQSARARLEERIRARAGRIVIAPDDEGVWSVTVTFPLDGPTELMVTATEEGLEAAFAAAAAALDAALAGASGRTAT